MIVPPAWPWVVPLLVLAALYATGRRHQPVSKSWSRWRTVSWYGGLAVAGIALIGPVAGAARESFTAHMLGHLLLGMLAPILLVLGAPITLLLRALPVRRARQAVTVLSSPPLRFLSHPITAVVLNVAGLVLLYRTDLYGQMHEHETLYLLVHAHILAAGYLFTAAMIGIDPIAHRPSYRFRMVVLMLALGAHAVLAKSLYALPPAGVPLDQTETGSRMMYYGGDIVDLLLVVIFCWQWYRATAPRPTVEPSTTPATAVEARQGAHA